MCTQKKCDVQLKPHIGGDLKQILDQHSYFEILKIFLMVKSQKKVGNWSLVFSVLPQGDGLLLDAFLCDDADTKGISSVDISLCSRDEDIFDQLNGFLLS